MSPHRVVITGIGAVTPFGNGCSALWNGIKESRSCLRYNKKLKFVVGQIDDEHLNLERWTKGERREMSRASQLALIAAEEALTSSNATTISHEETLVNVGTGVADLEHIAETSHLLSSGQSRRISPYFVPRILSNLPSGYICMKWAMMGGAESAATACATGVHCIGNAFRAVRQGWARRALAGGTEAAISEIGVIGFDRMRALARGESPTLSCPFDKHRSGFVMSEGAGLVFLERLEDAKQRGAKIYAEVLGYGISSDCYHVSAPDPSGIGAKLSMKRALNDANFSQHDITYVNAHATSTPTGDAIEAKAITETFKGGSIDVSSVKGHLGHLLAAAGAVETIVTIFAINDALIPGNLNLVETDLTNTTIRLPKENNVWSNKSRRAIVNSFGFGGTNASLILSNCV